MKISDEKNRLMEIVVFTIQRNNISCKDVESIVSLIIFYRNAWSNFQWSLRLMVTFAVACLPDLLIDLNLGNKVLSFVAYSSAVLAAFFALRGTIWYYRLSLCKSNSKVWYLSRSPKQLVMVFIEEFERAFHAWPDKLGQIGTMRELTKVMRREKSSVANSSTPRFNHMYKVANKLFVLPKIEEFEDAVISGTPLPYSSSRSDTAQ